MPKAKAEPLDRVLDEYFAQQRDEGDLSLPDGTAERVLRRARQGQQTRARITIMVGTMAMAAGLALAAGGGWLARGAVSTEDPSQASWRRVRERERLAALGEQDLVEEHEPLVATAGEALWDEDLDDDEPGAEIGEQTDDESEESWNTVDQ
jgi:hypothetical protein